MINIKTELTRNVISDAQVFIFFDESQTTNTNGYMTTYPDFVLTDKNGNFKSINYFNSFKKRSFFKGDICTRKPTRLEIIIIKVGFKTKRMIFSGSDLKKIEEKGKSNIILPEILLEKGLFPGATGNF